MDQIKIGKFIAELRKEKGYTQERLGELIGVTNKTVSRWENGNYMPDIEMLSLLSKEFDVSINEIILGERIPAEGFKKAADANLAAALNDSVFTLKEKLAYFKKKVAQRTRLERDSFRRRVVGSDNRFKASMRWACYLQCDRRCACRVALRAAA